METSTLLSVSTSVAAALFGLLSVVIGWVGSRVIVKQDEMMTKLDTVKNDLHGRISHLEARLVRVETLIRANP